MGLFISSNIFETWLLFDVGPFLWVTDGRTGRWETGAVEGDPGRDALAAVAGCRIQYHLTCATLMPETDEFLFAAFTAATVDSHINRTHMR